MNNKEKVEYLESCYNEDTGKYDIPCKCGLIRHLNIRQVWVINMHRLTCKTCDSIIIEKYPKNNNEKTNSDLANKLSKLKRYDHVWDWLEEHEHGEYVKYDDVLELIIKSKE